MGVQGEKPPAELRREADPDESAGQKEITVVERGRLVGKPGHFCFCKSNRVFLDHGKTFNQAVCDRGSPR